MIGPRDSIDSRLVQIYANIITSNFERINIIDPDKMMQMMSISAHNNRAFVELGSNYRIKKTITA